MYGPPPDCKSVEVWAEGTVCVNVSGLYLETRSPGLDDDSRVLVLISRAVNDDSLP